MKARILVPWQPITDPAELPAIRIESADNTQIQVNPELGGYVSVIIGGRTILELVDSKVDILDSSMAPAILNGSVYCPDDDEVFYVKWNGITLKIMAQSGKVSGEAMGLMIEAAGHSPQSQVQLQESEGFTGTQANLYLYPKDVHSTDPLPTQTMSLGAATGSGETGGV